MVTKKTPKKNIVKTIEEAKPTTAEDLILGNAPLKETKKVVSYEDPSIEYKVTNLRLNNEPMFVTGEVIEVFIGGNNLIARQDLKDGKKEVITRDYNNKDEYKIEVI